ncbi:MAG: phospho-N-acetylmuramoyl-pentapeptide-transferase [Lachnospiraceae bacterium]|nr:phospho-N-acetylmuramoyl-pentapeptide-transferase [Lachnospiraceae bacterium]
MITLIENFNADLSARFFGVLFAFAATYFLTKLLMDRLPKDGGREFAHDGKLSKGKPRGAGIIFVLVFALSAFIFVKPDTEKSIYILLIVLSMFTGFLDDAAKSPWGELKKGILDLVIAAAVAGNFLYFNYEKTDRIFLETVQTSLRLPLILYAILITALVWGSVNVTNCTDGVDGLSGTLAIITIMSIAHLIPADGAGNEWKEGASGAWRELFAEFTDYRHLAFIFAACIAAYLIFNATPSLIMMGDAGSRAMGLFIAVLALRTFSPIMYIPFGIVIILDGGLGLLKVTIIRLFKVNIMKKLRTPLHDHVRKNLGWSNTQTVFRFAIIQLFISALTLALCHINYVN